MHGHAGDVDAAHLDLASMNAYPHLDVQRADGVDDRLRAVDCDAGAGERCDESVAGRVHFATAKSLELMANHAVVIVEQVAPPAVAECRGALGGADDVCEHERGEHAL